MGRGNRFKETQQPDRIRESGIPRDDEATNSEPGSESSDAAQGLPDVELQEELVVELVRLDLDRVQVVGIGDKVEVNIFDSRISVSVQQGRLGDIPPDFEGAVRGGPYHRGIVSEVIRSRPLVQVTLFRT